MHKFKKLIFSYYCLLHNFFNRNCIKIVNDNNEFIRKNVILKGLTLTILGKNNKILIDQFCLIKNLNIKINGKNNFLYIGKEAVIISGDFKILGNDTTMKIGDKTSIRGASFNAIGEGKKLVLGSDCMLGDGIKIWTGDAHPIIDLKTKKQIAKPEDIIIGDRVWIGSDCLILKGARIGNNCILGTKTIFKGKLKNNCLVVGNPARILKNNIEWQRKRMYKDK